MGQHCPVRPGPGELDEAGCAIRSAPARISDRAAALTAAALLLAGNAKLSLVLYLMDGVVLRIGLSWLFGIVFGLGFYGFVLGCALAPYGSPVPGMICFLAGRWKTRATLADRM